MFMAGHPPLRRHALAAGQMLRQVRSWSGWTESHTHLLNLSNNGLWTVLPWGFQVELLIPHNLHSFRRWGEYEWKLEGKSSQGRKEEAECFVSLLRTLNNLPSLWEILVIQSMLWALAWKFVSTSLAVSFPHSHSLSDHGIFSENWKTNIQEIRMSFLRHYKPLLMAMCTAKEAVTKAHTKYLHLSYSGIN